VRFQKSVKRLEKKEQKTKANENRLIERRKGMKNVKAVILAAGEGTRMGHP